MSRRSRAPLLLLTMSLLLVHRPLRAETVPADSSSRADAILKRPPIQLPPLIVQGDRSYRVLRTTTGTRTDTPLRDVPQSISVITRDLIADQQMSSLADVVRSVPGVTMGQGEGNRDQPMLRGNSGNGDLFIDGMRDDVEYLRDLYNVERVEVPKGGNAMIFGRGAGGGLINRVTKTAGWSRSGELSLRGGQHDDFRGAVDAGGGLGRVLAGRFNGMYENSDSYRSDVHLERTGLSPTVTIAAGTRTQLRAAYEFFRDHRTADRGVPSFRGAPLDTDPSTFFGDPTISWSHVTVRAGTAAIEHTTPFGLRIRNQTRVADYDKMYQNVFSGAVDSTATQVAIQGYNNRMNRTNVFNQTDLIYRLGTGRIRHVLLGGGELGRQSTDAFRNTAYFDDANTSVLVPVARPLTTGTPVTFRQSATDADAHTRALVTSAYLQDQMEFTRWAQAVAGVRLDEFALDYHNRRTNVNLSRTDTKVSPRLGLVLKPATPLSVYGSWTVSFLPSSGALFTSLNVTTQTLEPEQFTNYEVGLKWEDRARSASLAVYQLDRTNTSAPDPANPAHTIQTGSQRSRGLEAEASGQVTAKWSAVAGVTVQRVEVTSRTSQALVGATPAMTPDYTLSLWSRWQLARSLGVGLGLLRQAKVFAAIDDAVTLPAFTRADAAVFARVSDRVAMQVNVENLFDTRYWSTANSNNNITPGAPRTLRAAMNVRY